MNWKIRGVEPWSKGQTVIWLEDPNTGADGPGDGTQWCATVRLPELPGLIQQLFEAYTKQMQDLAVDLAAGGCRTCKNTRRVNGNPLAALMGQDDGSKPCPDCLPRAEKRLRDRIWGIRSSRERRSA